MTKKTVINIHFPEGLAVVLTSELRLIGERNALPLYFAAESRVVEGTFRCPDCNDPVISELITHVLDRASVYEYASNDPIISPFAFMWKGIVFDDIEEEELMNLMSAIVLMLQHRRHQEDTNAQASHP